MEHTQVAYREYRWHEFSRRLTRRFRTTVITIAAYPLAVLGAVIAAVLFLTPDSAMVLRDVTTFLIALFICFLAVAPAVRRLQARHRWFAMVARIVTAMERGTSFLAALGATGDRNAETITAAIRTGNRPSSAFRRHAAPGSIVTALESAVDETDLRKRLDRNVQEYQEEAFHRLVHMERIMQPAAVALAGAAVIWLVVRVVIPTLVLRLGPISGV
ncbi:MAG: hypothetical protein PF508_19930 [Spirochaeta sp.]|jgi:type II secretory pathway component PulF|nr:hypothetical protein [Spirochaeta sp.]